jgi:hypothetical protein
LQAENLFVSSGAEFALQSTLQLSAGGIVDIGLASNISFELATAGQCSALSGAISVEMSGRMKITCANISGTTAGRMKVNFPNVGTFNPRALHENCSQSL